MAAAPEVALCRSAPSTLAVRGPLVFENVAGVLAQARGLLADAPGDTLDLAGVTRADSAGLACVLSMLAAARADGGALKIVNVPDGLRALARVCEVDSLLA